ARREPSNVAVIIGAVPDGMIEDRRIRGQSGYRQFIDVVLQCAAAQEGAGDIVEPKALSEIVQCLCRVHRAGSKLDADIGGAGRNRVRSKLRRSPMRSIMTSAGGKTPTVCGSRA